MSNSSGNSGRGNSFVFSDERPGMVDELFTGQIAVVTSAGRNIGAGIARRFAAEDVRANAISPGNVGDPVGQTSGCEGGFDTSPIPPDRIGEPEDVADAAVFLASDMADYISSANVPVDGGKSA